MITIHTLRTIRRCTRTNITSFIASGAAAALVAFGLTAGSQSAVALAATFALAGLAGYQVVWKDRAGSRKRAGQNDFRCLPIELAAKQLDCVYQQMECSWAAGGHGKSTFGW